MPLHGPGEEPLRIEHDIPEEEQERQFSHEAGESDPGGHKAQVKAQMNAAKRLADATDMRQTAAKTHRDLTTAPPKVPDATVADPAKSDDLNKKIDALQQALDHLKSTQHSDLEWTASSYLVATASFVAIGIGVLSVVQYFCRKSVGKGTDDIPALDDKTKQALDQLLNQWKALSDSAYWESVATYIQSHPDQLSLGDQLVFMNLTVMLGGFCNGFLWDSAQDQSKNADTLIAAYQSGGNSTPAMIRAAAAMTYNGQPVPRVVVAQLLQLAFAWIGVKASGR
jgi:hypothetical protein